MCSKEMNVHSFVLQISKLVFIAIRGILLIEAII